MCVLPAGTEAGRGREPGLPAPRSPAGPRPWQVHPARGQGSMGGQAVPEVLLGAQWMVGANPHPEPGAGPGG